MIMYNLLFLSLYMHMMVVAVGGPMHPLPPFTSNG